MSIALTKYSTPPPHLIYSDQFFKQITIQFAATMDYPAIAPRGALSWAFSTSIPTATSTISVAPEDWVPCFDDLWPICQQMSDAFDKGKRSVVVNLVVNNETITQICHLIKVAPAILIAQLPLISLSSCRFVYLYPSIIMRLPSS